MRGAPSTISYSLLRSRIIPADAGSTTRHQLPVWSCADHPRGCGEHGLCLGQLFLREGSSPRMRGAQLAALSPGEYVGIIPADAGSTKAHSYQDNAETDHPRGCGEHDTMFIISIFSCGSSPRMRGAHRLEKQISNSSRIIPADAGSTSRRLRRRSACPDHPRGCGEHSAPCA